MSAYTQSSKETVARSERGRGDRNNTLKTDECAIDKKGRGDEKPGKVEGEGGSEEVWRVVVFAL